ncbi:hypothetical protein I7I53_09829 [Histoplasma capsulatum var. duboisii H88]|uniref:Uncharacterized protein n=1 Tax=Ajellomyces capsulatus (strain H88) TaxID=544711 RepID=A0A8A1L9W6_AJEC8|nr:hypothetical protein I7I53_09829 [Histoplasma capsulatum var. duboisii H88]
MACWTLQRNCMKIVRPVSFNPHEFPKNVMTLCKTNSSPLIRFRLAYLFENAAAMKLKKVLSAPKKGVQ